MDDDAWYTDASLRASDHVFCVGSLAQCVRKWKCLAEIERRQAHIELGPNTLRRKRIEGPELAALAAYPRLMKL